MVDAVKSGRFLRIRAKPPEIAATPLLSSVAGYGISVILVGAGVFLAFLASSVVPVPALTLIFVLPVVISGTAFGLGPSVAATLASVLAFDFFFTQPYFRFRMTEPSEIWAAALLLITATIVSTVAWQSRQYALEARLAAERADELRGLAHVVIEGASQAQIVQSAAGALSRIFDAPAAIFSEIDGKLGVAGSAGKVDLTQAESEAAEGALASQIHMRGQTYPHDRSSFDMWPVATQNHRYVLAVAFGASHHDRPADADRLVEIVAGYLVANITRTSE